MDGLLDEEWLYRGVPDSSHEVLDVQALGAIEPPRPDRVGERHIRNHVWLGYTDTAYTSWTTDPAIARAAAEAKGSGRIVVFRVAICSLDEDRVYPGRLDEAEWLLEGTVDGVEIDPDSYRPGLEVRDDDLA